MSLILSITQSKAREATYSYISTLAQNFSVVCRMGQEWLPSPAKTWHND